MITSLEKIFMPTTQQTEVELRALLNDQEWERLREYCEAHGRFLGRENRFFVDYSTFIEGIGTRKLDVRVRITNGHPEIVTKQGSFGGGARTEAIARLEGSDAASAFQVMGMLGYRRGVACDRGISRYDIDGIEIAIQDVRRYGKEPKLHSRFFEAEMMCAPEDVAEAESRIRTMMEDAHLRHFEENDWYEYVRMINEEANGVFDLDHDGLATYIKLDVGQPPTNDEE